MLLVPAKRNRGPNRAFLTIAGYMRGGSVA
jgi:hypothetical protein